MSVVNYSHINELNELAIGDLVAAGEVLRGEAELDRMEREIRKAHIQRLNQGLCTCNSGSIYLDILGNLERIGDHSKNIAQYVL